MLDFEVYNVRNLAKTLLKHAQIIPEPCPKHVRNMPETWPNHAKNMAKTLPKHGQNMANTCPKHVQNIAKTLLVFAKSTYSWPKHLLLLRNQYILGQNIAYSCEIDISLAKTLLI